MIEGHRRSIRKASTHRLPAFAITWAAILLAASSIALPQEKQSNPARESPANVQFVSGHSALNIPFDFEFNQIVLQVRVNNSAPMKFMFDTGASGSLLSTRSAAALNLKSADDAKVTGVGGSAEGSFATGVSLSVATARRAW